MESVASPTKRRALTSLDANALPSPRPIKQQPDVNVARKHALTPFKDTPEGSRKRGLETQVTSATSPLKKMCREDDARSRSESPCSSVFDMSGHDSSWANTTATEPDTSPLPRAMTREQAREKAEILRLRLGLASYKLRTGQTTVPLANLQRKPILPRQKRDELLGLQLGGEGSSTGRKESEQDGSRPGEAEPEARRPAAGAGVIRTGEALSASFRALSTPHVTPTMLRDGRRVEGGAGRGQSAAAAAAADLLRTARAALDS